MPTSVLQVPMGQRRPVCVPPAETGGDWMVPVAPLNMTLNCILLALSKALQVLAVLISYVYWHLSQEPLWAIGGLGKFCSTNILQGNRERTVLSWRAGVGSIRDGGSMAWWRVAFRVMGAAGRGAQGTGPGAPTQLAEGVVDPQTPGTGGCCMLLRVRAHMHIGAFLRGHGPHEPQRDPALGWCRADGVASRA